MRRGCRNERLDRGHGHIGQSRRRLSRLCPGTSNYPITGSLDVLRLVYSGMHHDGTTFDCNGNVRRSLVKGWSALFDTGCATTGCTGGLTHAWRRSDLAGATEAFVNLVGFGARGIGTLSTALSTRGRDNDVPCGVRLDDR